MTTEVEIRYGVPSKIRKGGRNGHLKMILSLFVPRMVGGRQTN